MRTFGKRFYRAWQIIFLWFFFPLGTIGWWVDPLFGGPIWGRVIATLITFTFFFLVYMTWKEHFSCEN